MNESTTILEHINSFLPSGIKVWSITRVQAAFNPRTFCDSRMYDYCLPTYVFLPPKPSTPMAQSIEKARKRCETYIQPASNDADAFWSSYFAEHPDLPTAPPLPTTTNVDRKEEDSVPSPIFMAEMAAKRKYRISAEMLDNLRSAATAYEGNHNFHNFTIGKDFKERSAVRSMKSLTVSSFCCASF